MTVGLIMKLEELLKKNSKPALFVIFSDKTKKPELGMYHVHNEKILQIHWLDPNFQIREETYKWDKDISGFEEVPIEEMVYLLRKEGADIQRANKKIVEIDKKLNDVEIAA
jgi:hypothetical protein